MNKREILKMLEKYTGYMYCFFFFVGGILGLVVENGIPAAISLTCSALCITTNILLDSYLYYTDLNLEKGQNKFLTISFIFEIVLLLLILLNFLISLFTDPHYLLTLIISILIVISSFCSILFEDLGSSKHNRKIKIVLCILYTLHIILVCATTL